MLKIVGAGLPRTGTASLAAALEILGYETLHHAPERLPLDDLALDMARSYDDVEAVLDAPACAFWQEIAGAYRCKVILTRRDVRQWYQSIAWHHNQIMTGGDAGHVYYTRRLHALLFGSEHPQPWLWQARFRQHNHAAVLSSMVKDGNLLIMNICDGGDKWDVLCPFLGIDKPACSWPWKNKKPDEDKTTEYTEAVA